MPRGRASLSKVFRVERFKRATVARPIVRLHSVSEAALTEVSLNGSGVKAGELLVLGIDPELLATCTERELLDALHAVIKHLRNVRGVKQRPSAEALRIHQLKEEEGLTVAAIAKRFGKRWPDCTDLESRERRVKHDLRRVRAYLAGAKERELASLTPRQRAILKTLDGLPPVEPTTD